MTISCTSPRCVAYNHFDKSKPSKNTKVAITSQSSREGDKEPLCTCLLFLGGL